MTNFNSELRNILEDYARKSPNCIEEDIGYTNDTISAITELVKGIVPESQSLKGWLINGKTAIRRQGFNSCRIEMLERLED